MYYFIFRCLSHLLHSFPGDSDGKEPACNTGDPGSIPELGRCPEKEMATHSSIPMCKFHGQRSLVGKQSMGSLTSEQKASGDFPGGSMVKNPPCNAEIVDKTPVRELRPHAPHSKPVCSNY